MTDTFDANAPSGLSGEQLSQVDGWLRDAGHGDKIPGSGGGVTPSPAAGNPAGAVSGNTPGGEFLGANGSLADMGLSASEVRQVREMAEWSRSRGDNQTADELLRANGMYRGPELQKLYAADAAAGMPITAIELEHQAAQYDWSSVPHPTDKDGNPLPDAYVIDRKMEIGRAFARAGFDRGATNVIIEHTAKIEPKWSKLDDGGKEIYKREQSILLEKAWGADYQKNIDETAAFVDHIGGEAWHWLGSTGAGATAMVILQLHSRLQQGRDGINQHRSTAR